MLRPLSLAPAHNLDALYSHNRSVLDHLSRIAFPFGNSSRGQEELTVSFWFCGGLGSLLGGAGALGLASGLAAESFSCALTEFRSPGAVLFFSRLPPVPAGLVPLSVCALQGIRKESSYSQGTPSLIKCRLQTIK